MALVVKLTDDAKLKLGIKKGTESSFVARFKKLTSDELKNGRNPAYSPLI